MISKSELGNLAKARLDDAVTLRNAKRFDGSVYICGYSVELSLKLRICKTLNWSGFPSANNEFKEFRSFKTHKYDTLLTLSGIEETVKVEYLTEWSAIAIWDPEIRYQSAGNIGKKDADKMIYSAEKLLAFL